MQERHIKQANDREKKDWFCGAERTFIPPHWWEPLCKQTPACTNHQRRGRTHQVTLTNELYCLWIWETSRRPIKAYSVSIYHFSLEKSKCCLPPAAPVSTPTTGCVSATQRETRLTRKWYIGEELELRRYVCMWGGDTGTGRWSLQDETTSRNKARKGQNASSSCPRVLMRAYSN